MKLEIKIFNGEATEKYLSKLKKLTNDLSQTNTENPESARAATPPDGASRTGHMSKKMIEAYEQGLQ